jgi:threonine/homoserine/homoserine lactone efflux protein
MHSTKGKDLMMGVAFLVLLAIGGVLAYPDQPLAWLVLVVVLLGAGGLVWRYWLGIRSEQAIIDLERRSRR